MHAGYFESVTTPKKCLEQSISYNPFEGGACYLTVHKNFNCRGKGGKVFSSTSIEIRKAFVTVTRSNEVVLYSPERNKIAERVWTIVGNDEPMNEGWPKDKSEDFVESVKSPNSDKAKKIQFLFEELIRSCS